jgi:YebC/PmpR family DNA-binding regulatory protein
MSGHSKWSTIKHKKSLKDERRGTLFSKLVKAISIAAREGPDPESNFKLRLAVEKAKEANVPKTNIERAIARGSGGAGGEQWEETAYEGYGPEGIAVMVEVATDNKNRTAAEIKNIFERGGGSLTRPGAVSYQFEKVGLIRVKKTANVEEAILSLIDLGAEDVEEAEDAIEVFTRPEEFDEMAKKIQAANFSLQGKELFMRPKTFVKITDSEKKEKVLKFMETLEDHEDVQKVFANFDLIG